MYAIAMNWRKQLLGLMVVVPLAGAQTPTVPTHGQAIEVRNCVGGPPITVRPDDARALLDDDERESLLGEMRSRYPMLERDGFTALAILLWRRSADEWLYVTLRYDGFTRGMLCFNASFVAKVFRITPDLMAKYRSPPPAISSSPPPASPNTP